MAAPKKKTRPSAGSDQFYTKVVDVTMPDGECKQVTFYSDRAEDLKLLDEPTKPKKRARTG
jgi:hypothetical protein